MTQSAALWQPAETLTERVRRLRADYFSFNQREHRNEVQAYGTGKQWDIVFAMHNWTIVPEVLPFLRAYEDTLAACAQPVALPDTFYKQPLVLRRAAFFAEVLARYLPTPILEGELIIGSSFNTALSLTLTETEAKTYSAEELAFFKDVTELNAAGVGNCGAVPGHIIPNYAKALKVGLKGLVEEIERLTAAYGAKGNEVRQAMVLTAKAAQTLASRYADEAERLAGRDASPQRKAELHDLARICSKVPWQPAATFHEALQSLWFMHFLIMAAESYPGPGLSLGRIDQYLYPYYEKDIQTGRLTKEQAKELLHCWWIKHNYAYDYQGRVGNNQGITSGYGQLITIGGIDAEGNDASNDLTWLLLEVLEDMNMLEPKPNIRLHQKTPDAFLQRVAQLIAKAQGSPFLLNFDERSIAGLAWQGLPKDQLWDYAPVGCLENTLQGNDRSGTVDVNFNLAKAVELAFNNGVDQATKLQLGPQTGDPCQFKDYAQFLEAVKKQLATLLDTLIAANNRADELRARFQPTPYLSLLVDGCAEKGLDVTAGGAVHNYITVEGVAFATLVDSVLAVKNLVYEKGRIPMPELAAALQHNYEGYEKVKLLLENKAPKYGNDDDAADAVARDLHRYWTKLVAEKTTPFTKKRYRAGYLSWNYWVFYGAATAATPDGRPAGRFLSNGSCPVTGKDLQGPTARARSVGKLGLETAPNGDSHTISFSPALLRDKEHVDKLAAFLRAYCREGGTALQVNVVDADMLRAAQANPEEFKNLLVRVTGYNAYFVRLGKEIQDEIISRESHRV